MNRNYEYLFKKEENKGIEWGQKYREFIEQKIFDKNYNFNYDDTEIYSEEYLIFSIIISLCDPHLSDFTKQCEIIKLGLSDIVKSYDIDIKNKKGLIKILTDKESISVIKISGNIKEMPKNKYKTISRFRYEQLIELSKNLTIENKVVTGYVHGGSEKEKKIHSWIEINHKNKEYVMDLKNNLIMNKSAYYFLRHVKKINEISKEILKDDEQLFNEFNQILNLDEQEYLIFRDSIIKDLKKNKHLVKGGKI